MKDNLEDLLKQVYAQKEEPSQEFCQSVIQKMKRRNKNFFERIGGGGCYKGILMAAICAGIIILAGMGICFYRQGKSQDKGISGKWGIAEQGNHAADVTESPFGAGNGTEANNRPEGEKQSETKNGSDDKKQVETENSSDQTKQVETTQIPDSEQESSGGNAGYPPKAHEDSGNLSGSEQNLSTKPKERNTGTEGNGTERKNSDSGTGSGNWKPQIMETAEPTRTSIPMPTSETILPSKTMPPQETPDPQGNYIALCSIETHVFSSDIMIPAGEEIVFPDSVFDSRLILSYEQLQMLIGEIEEQLAQNPNNGLQNTLVQLRRYDQSYFVSNALCVNLSLVNAGVDLNLQAVRIRDVGQGNYYLDIWLDKVCDGTEQISEINYYSSFISVPQTIAGQCDMVEFHFS